MPKWKATLWRVIIDLFSWIDLFLKFPSANLLDPSVPQYLDRGN